MRRLGHLLSIGALLLVSAACGQNDEIGFGGAPMTTGSELPSTDPGEPSSAMPPGEPGQIPPPAGSVPVPEAKVDASALPEGYPRVAWTEGDGRTLGAYGQAGGCIEASAEVREQTAQRVVLRITETVTSTGPCTMEIRFPPLSVTLDSPLGDRTVVLERTQVGPR